MEVKRTSSAREGKVNLNNRNMDLYSQSKKILKINNKNQDVCNPQTDKVVKTLYSPFHIKPKPFNSVLLCKQNKLQKDKLSKTSNNITSNYVEPYGPLIVVHKENRKKVKAPPKKFRFDEEPVIKFDYFDKMRNHKETKLLWTDTQHPIILKHYNKEFDKNKYSKLDNKRYWTIK
jgi:hypothetical protein